jgi:hypothetical protein
MPSTSLLHFFWAAFRRLGFTPAVLKIRPCPDVFGSPMFTPFARRHAENFESAPLSTGPLKRSRPVAGRLRVDPEAPAAADIEAFTAVDVDALTAMLGEEAPFEEPPHAARTRLPSRRVSNIVAALALMISA